MTFNKPFHYYQSFDKNWINRYDISIIIITDKKIKKINNEYNKTESAIQIVVESQDICEYDTSLDDAGLIRIDGHQNIK